VPNRAKGVPARFVSVRPATAAKGSSEGWRLCLRPNNDLVRALLNADLVGFHTFDYAQHFLTACSRLLGLDYQSKRGYISIEYYDRTVTVKILPVGIDMGQLR
jgi:trehalose-6-phosphate synthase